MVHTSDDVLVWVEGAVGRLRLNRPSRLNALSHEMVKVLRVALDNWRDDPDIQCVVIDGAGEKAFCAGGDIAALHAARGSDVKGPSQFWFDQYGLDWTTANYPKPYIALMDGIVMGGGAGISAHGSHRIVTERTALAMPECAIGFLPDVGGTWLLRNAPGQSGKWIGMTGARLGAQDAIYTGFADVCVPSDQLPDLVKELVAGTSIDDLMDRYKVEPSGGCVERYQSVIDQIFSATTALGSVEALSEFAQNGKEWAKSSAENMVRASPFAVTAAFAAHNMAAHMAGLEEALALEYRFACNMWGGHDFFEGIRAMIIDKDKQPKWQPASFEEVELEDVRRFLTSLPNGKGLIEFTV